MSVGKCEEGCRTIPDATACSFYPGECTAHTKKGISVGGINDYICYVFPGDTFTEVHLLVTPV